MYIYLFKNTGTQNVGSDKFKANNQREAQR